MANIINLEGSSRQSYPFQGPFESIYSTAMRSGVYAVLDGPMINGQYKVIDIGESADIQNRLLTHDRSVCWLRNSAWGLRYAVCYTLSENQRYNIEQDIRNRYYPLPCGKR